MDIAILIKEFPPDSIGGTQTQTKRMATALENESNNITVVTKRYRDHDDSDLEFDVMRIPNIQWSPFISDLTFLLMSFLLLIPKARRFDCLQCMWIYPIGFLGFMLNTVTRVPYFAAVRGNDFYEMREIWWKRWMIRRVLADTTIHVLSDDMKQDIQEYFPDLDPEFVIIGNGISMPDEKIDRDADTVLFVGRLAPKKGVEYLIEASASVAAEHELVIVGDGSERERLERLAADLEVPARFEGFVDPQDIDEYYRSSGIFVLPSTEGEGMPNAVLEAMSWGIPIVVTTSGALPEMIRDGENGFIVPMRDSEAIAERLELMLEDLKTRRTVGDGARAYIGETHSWEAITEQFEDLYQYVSSGR